MKTTITKPRSRADYHALGEQLGAEHVQAMKEQYQTLAAQGSAQPAQTEDDEEVPDLVGTNFEQVSQS
jgi:hypothetical protein